MKKRKLITIFGLFVFLLLTITTVNATTTSFEMSKEYEEFLEKNWYQVELGTKISNYMYSEYDIKDYYVDEYPSWFGGMYMSDNAENLMLQVVEKNIPLKGTHDYDVYNEIINIDGTIKIEYVKYSFNELNYTNNFVSENLFNGKVENIRSSYLDIMNNSVRVELESSDAKVQEKITSIILGLNKDVNIDLILFSEIESISSSANINAGGGIRTLYSNPDYTCSMGMRIRYNGNNGYLTAGHCAVGVSSFPSGTVMKRQYSNDQNFDYAFIKTNYSYTPTNNLAYTTTGITKLAVVNFCPVLMVNTTISKAGMTTRYSTGNVTGLNQTVVYNRNRPNEITLKGMVVSNVYQGKGDSGGVVMIPRSDSNGGAIGVGILSGGVHLSNYMVFTDVHQVVGIQTRY